MALVDYESDASSSSASVPPTVPRKAVARLINARGKIALPPPPPPSEPDDEPPRKRARPAAITLAAALPPPKHTRPPPARGAATQFQPLAVARKRPAADTDADAGVGPLFALPAARVREERSPDADADGVPVVVTERNEDEIAEEGGEVETEARQHSLAALAETLGLPASARRQLVGAVEAQVRVVDMGLEYATNAAARASGQAEREANARPVRAIQPGRHNIRQLVGMVQGQREALQESFARGKGNRREAAARYGW